MEQSTRCLVCCHFKRVDRFNFVLRCDNGIGKGLIILFVSVAAGQATGGKESTLGESISRFIFLIDGYLLGAFMLIFGFGFYELFVADLQPARQSTGSNRVLVIKSLDDLKERLGKVILLIMIVEVFKDAVKITLNQPLDLLYMAASIGFIALGLYLTHSSESEKKSKTQIVEEQAQSSRAEEGR